MGKRHGKEATTTLMVVRMSETGSTIASRAKAYHYSSGNMYEGDWVDGKIEGVGTLTYTDGDRYVGSWSDGQMHGTGTYYYASGDIYEGEWRADKRHGGGTVTYMSGSGEPTEASEG